MSTKLVSVSHLEVVRKIANESSKVKIGGDQIVVPSDARIHTLRIRYNPARPWQEAINVVGPDIPSHYNVWKVGDQYPPTGTEEVEEDLVLINYPDGSGDWGKALAWGKSRGLEKTVPREAFAVGDQYPNLHNEIGMNPVYVVATTPCTFQGGQQACYVWWDDAAREANLYWTSDLNEQNDWFLFRKTVLKTKML